MIKKVFKRSCHAIASIVLICSILLAPWVNSMAIAEDDNGDNPLKIVILPSEENEAKKDADQNQDIDIDEMFGSEQVFPFEAGFGKNSGKS